MVLIEVGQLVTSKMGRDFGKKYVVIGFYDDSHVQVADGFVRKMNRPKRKNTKHLVVHAKVLGAEALDDKKIRQFIEEHSNGESLGEEGFEGYGQG